MLVGKRIVVRAGLSFGGDFCGNRIIVHYDLVTLLTVKFIFISDC